MDRRRVLAFPYCNVLLEELHDVVRLDVSFFVGRMQICLALEDGGLANLDGHLRVVSVLVKKVGVVEITRHLSRATVV